MNRIQFVTCLAVMAVMSLAGSFLAVLVLGDAPVNAQDGDKASKVVASEFQLKDKNGKLRALMSVDDKKGLLFILLDSKQQPRITQSVSDDGDGSIVITDDKGKPRMSLTSGADEPGTFSVFDSSGHPAAVLGVGKGDYPLITLGGPTGQAVFGIQSNGQGVLTLSGISGEGEKQTNDAYFSVVGGPNIPSVMILENAQGKGKLQLQANEDGSNIFSMTENKELRCFLSSGGGETTALELDNGSGSTVYLQAQKSGSSVLQLNGGENYVRSISNADGTAEFSIIKGKKFAWTVTGEKQK